MSQIAMVITSRANPGRREELFELYREHLAPRAEANDDQQVVLWCEDQQDEDVFHLLEVYRHGEALGANAQSEWFAEYMQAAMPLLAGEPSVAMTTPRWTTGVPAP